MQCQDCGHTWTGPGYDSEINHGGSCPSCNSYSLQPTPIHSEMEMRNMPLPAGNNSTRDDMGGNPLQEGIWGSIDGGWKNRMKRDESFASVRKVAETHADGFIHGGPHGALEEIHEKTGQQLMINGKPFHHGPRQGEFMGPWLNHRGPVTVSHPKPVFEQLAADCINRSSHTPFLIWKAEQQKKALERRKQQGLASVHVAFDDDDDIWDVDDGAEYNPYQGESEHDVQDRFIVTQDGQVLRGEHSQGRPPFHEEIAIQNGINTDADPTAHFTGPYSLGTTYQNGQMDFSAGHKSGLGSEQMSQLLAQHYPNHQVPEGLDQASGDSRWGGEELDPEAADRAIVEKGLGPEKTQQYDKLQGIQDEHSELDKVVDQTPQAGLPIADVNTKSLQHQMMPEEAPENLTQSDPQMAAIYKDYRKALRDGNEQMVRYLQNEISQKMRMTTMPNGLPRKKREMEILQGPSMPRSDYWYPQDSEGSVRGGSVNDGRGAIYEPWSHDASSDFEIAQIVEPGPHTEEVDVGEDNPLILQHDNPEVLENAKAKVGFAFIPAMMGAARAALPMLVRGALMPGAGGGGGATAQPQAPQQMPLQGYSSIHEQLTGAFDGAFDNHPSSDPKLVERASGDPDDVDSQEVNDGDHSEWQNDPEVGDGQEGTDAFAPEVEKALEDAMPSLMHYFHSEESGENDPAIQKLIELIEQHHPGHLDQDGDPGALDQLKVSNQLGVPGIGGIIPAPGAGQAQVAPQQQAPHSIASCGGCGAMVPAAAGGICPQCNAAVNVQPNTPTPEAAQQLPGAYPNGTQPYPTQPGRVAAHQGPHSLEQVQAVAQFLKENGREDEIAQIVFNPDLYADELAQVSGRDEPPIPDPDPGVPPPPMDPAMMGAPPGAPPGGMPMPMASYREAADSVAPQCPKCGSHTTGIVSDDGECSCSNCGNSWSPGGVQKQVEMPATAPKTAFEHADLHPHVDALGVPAADQVHPDDPAMDQNPGSWATEDGEPLQVGQEYEMRSARYDIPDIVRIEQIKPDEIEYSLTGEYNLAHRTSVSKEEAQMDGITFAPAGADSEEPNLNEQQPPDQMQAPIQESAPDRMARLVTAGKKFTPMEQREFIDEPGKARNSDKLDLANTHYNEQSDLSDDLFLFGL